jgi:dTDP-glucose 4,6-dehydratase
VVNFAAETHVDRSILEPDAFVKTDVQGTWTLAEAARAAGIERFVQISTDEVYGAVLSGASVETDRLDPTSPYSASKAGGELLVLASWKTYRFPAMVVRGANAYGPYQYPEKLIPLHITNAIDDQPLPVYGDGQQRRQWTHVADFATGVDAVLRHGTRGEIYNVGNPEAEDALPVNLTVSRRILALLGKPERLLELVIDRPAHDRRYRVDPSKLVGLGWRPEWTFARGLEATVRWYVDHQSWWRPIKSGEGHQAYYAQNYANRSAFAR